MLLQNKKPSQRTVFCSFKGHANSHTLLNALRHLGKKHLLSAFAWKRSAAFSRLSVIYLLNALRHLGKNMSQGEPGCRWPEAHARYLLGLLLNAFRHLVKNINGIRKRLVGALVCSTPFGIWLKINDPHLSGQLLNAFRHLGKS
jgi:hypothetical protein